MTTGSARKSAFRSRREILCARAARKKAPWEWDATYPAQIPRRSGVAAFVRTRALHIAVSHAPRSHERGYETLPRRFVRW